MRSEVESLLAVIKQLQSDLQVSAQIIKMQKVEIEYLKNTSAIWFESSIKNARNEENGGIDSVI